LNQDDPIAAFRVEAAEVLDGVEQALLDLGGRLDDAGLVDAVFRGLHTVKGSGAMFGFEDLAAFTHHCESAFDKVRKGQVRASGELVSVILAACDHMRSLLADDGAAAAPAGADILDQLAVALDAKAGAGVAGQADAPANASVVAAGWQLRFHLATDATVNGTNPLALLAELRELGDARISALTDAIPPLVELDPGECHVGWDVILTGAITREQIEDVFLFVLDDMELEIEPLAAIPGEAVVDAPASSASCAPASPIPSVSCRCSTSTA